MQLDDASRSLYHGLCCNQLGGRLGCLHYSLFVSSLDFLWDDTMPNSIFVQLSLLAYDSAHILSVPEK
jgi:hypothetical protein